MVFETDENQEGFEETPRSYLRQKSRKSGAGRKIFRVVLIAAAGAVLVVAGIMVFWPGGNDVREGVYNKKTLEIGNAGNLPRAPSQTGVDSGNSADMNSEHLRRLESAISDIETRIEENHEQLMGRLAELAKRVVENNEHVRESLKRMQDLEARFERLEQQYKSNGSRKTAKTQKDESQDQYYTVKKNDTMYSIAKNHGIELETFLEINGLNRDSVIYPGQRLKVSP